MPRSVVIVGAGGHGREVCNVLLASASLHDFAFVGFLDDGTPPTEPIERLGVQLLGPLRALEQLLATDDEIMHYIAIGDPSIRRTLAGGAERLGSRTAPPLIHPAAHLGLDVQLGAGSVLFPGAVLTTNVRVGRHVHLSPNVTVSHDVQIGDYVLAYPGVSVLGDAVVEAGVTLGANAVIHKGVRVGSGARIAPGAAIVHDVPATGAWVQG